MIATTCSVCRGEGTILSNPCKDCRGEGRVKKTRKMTVKIPPGVDVGTQLLLHHEGEAGIQGGETGDLYVFIHVKPDDRFVREGSTLHIEVPISIYTAALGGEVVVPTLNGDHSVKVPRGTEGGERAVLEGFGFPELRSRHKGDLIIHFKLKTPKNLSRKEEELLRELAEEAGEPVSKKKKGLFS